MASTGGGGAQLPDRATGATQLEVTPNDSDAMDVDQRPSAEFRAEILTRTQHPVQLRDEGRQAVVPSCCNYDRDSSMVHGTSHVAHHRPAAHLAGPSTSPTSLESACPQQSSPDNLEQPRPASAICSYYGFPRPQAHSVADPCSLPPHGTPTSANQQNDNTAFCGQAPSDSSPRVPLTDLPYTASSAENIRITTSTTQTAAHAQHLQGFRSLLNSQSWRAKTCPANPGQSSAAPSGQTGSETGAPSEPMWVGVQSTAEGCGVGHSSVPVQAASTSEPAAATATADLSAAADVVDAGATGVFLTLHVSGHGGDSDVGGGIHEARPQQQQQCHGYGAAAGVRPLQVSSDPPSARCEVLEQPPPPQQQPPQSHEPPVTETARGEVLVRLAGTSGGGMRERAVQDDEPMPQAADGLVLPKEDEATRGMGACRPSGSHSQHVAAPRAAHPTTGTSSGMGTPVPAPHRTVHRSASSGGSGGGAGTAAGVGRRRSQQGAQGARGAGDTDLSASRSGGGGSGGGGADEWWNEDNDGLSYTWAGAYGLGAYIDVTDDDVADSDVAAAGGLSHRAGDWAAAQGGAQSVSPHGTLPSQHQVQHPNGPSWLSQHHPHAASSSAPAGGSGSGSGPVSARGGGFPSPSSGPAALRSAAAMHHHERFPEGGAAAAGGGAGPSMSTGWDRGSGGGGYTCYEHRVLFSAGPELVAWDTWSEDEEEEADTTAEQFYAAERPKDIQGIPWDRLQFNRSTYRQTRLRQYRNYTNVLPDDDGGAYRAELEPLCVAPRRGGTAGTPPPPAVVARGPPFFSFIRNSRAVQSNIVHFQLRNLVWATSPNDVYVVHDNCVNHWNHVDRKVTEVLNLSGGGDGGAGGCSISPLRALGRVQVSTVCVSGDLLAAGGFLGELVVKRLSSNGAATTTGARTANPGTGEALGRAHAAASAAAGGRPTPRVVVSVAPTRRGGAQGGAQGHAGAAGGAAGDSKGGAGGGNTLLYCGRITASDNGITNGLEIFQHPMAGTTVLSANNDSQLRLFSAPAGEGTLRPLASWPFDWAVNYATVRPGTTVAAVVGDDSATLLKDIHNGTTVAQLLGHRDFSFAAAWHPGGVLLATGNQDTTALVWDIRRTDEPLTRLAGRMGAIRSLRFSPDGRFLAMSEPADFVHVYDVASGFQECQEHDFFGEIAGIAFTPDSSSLFVGVSDLTYASLMQLERQRCEW